MKEIASYYNKEQDTILIEVRARSVVRLFNPLDPSPIEQKVLDDATAGYIADAASEFSLKTPMKLVLYLPAEEQWQHQAEAITVAVHNYFEHRARVAARDLRQFFRRARISLVIGLLFLFACVTGRALVPRLGEGMFYKILAEGLLISGWVAMWRPMQAFLYDWWPIRGQRQVYRKLAGMEVAVVAAAAAAEQSPRTLPA